VPPPTLDAPATATSATGRPEIDAAPLHPPHPKGDVIATGSSERRLLVVDDDESVRRIVAAILKDEGYETTTAPSAQEALVVLQQQSFALVITDIKMPEHDGLWLLSELRRDHPEVAVIMMTGYGQVDTAVECLKYGASDYLTKPIRVNHLSASVMCALDRRRLELENRAYQRGLEGAVEEKTKELERLYHEISETYRITLEALVTALDARECETGNHSQRVVRLTLAIADRMGLTGPDRDHLARGALLHDIGKIGVSDQVLLKPGKLTPEEWVEMRKHPEIGARILSGISFLGPAAEIVLSHQERWDGKGYPRGLGREEIPIGARIFAVADALDAITSDRPYRRGRSFAFAREEISRNSGTQFDPDVVRHFLTITEEEWNTIRGEQPPFRARPSSRIEPRPVSDPALRRG
jgi:putative nucleotidyltransferase with HDIG domain